MRRLVPNHKDLSLYLSLPGIGDITALRLIAELGDLRRFDNPNQIDAFIGIDPSRYQSGEKDIRLTWQRYCPQDLVPHDWSNGSN